MKLKIKEEYKDWSFGGGDLGKIRLQDLDPSLYEKYYKMGFNEFFEEIESQKKENKKVENNDTDK